MLILGAIGQRGADAVIAGWQDGHVKRKFSPDLVPFTADGRRPRMGKIRIVAKQWLPQTVLDQETDDRCQEQFVRLRGHSQRDLFATDHPRQHGTVLIQKLDIGNMSAALAKGCGIGVEFKYLQIITQITVINEFAPLVRARQRLYAATRRNSLGCRTFSLLRLVISLQVQFADILRHTGFDDNALLEPDRMAAEVFNCARIVAYKQDRAIFHEPTQEAHALLRKKCIAYRQGFVDHQNIGIYMGNHRKRQAHHHAAGIRFHRLVDKVADIGKCLDVGKPGGSFIMGEAQHCRIQIHIFAPREFRVESGTQFQQCGHTAICLHTATGGIERTTYHLQQG